MKNFEKKKSHLGGNNIVCFLYPQKKKRFWSKNRLLSEVKRIHAKKLIQHKSQHITYKYFLEKKMKTEKIIICISIVYKHLIL